MAVGGAIGDFNAYSNAMKEKYNLTQSHGKSITSHSLMVRVQPDTVSR